MIVGNSSFPLVRSTLATRAHRARGTRRRPSHLSRGNRASHLHESLPTPRSPPIGCRAHRVSWTLDTTRICSGARRPPWEGRSMSPSITSQCRLRCRRHIAPHPGCHRAFRGRSKCRPASWIRGHPATHGQWVPPYRAAWSLSRAWPARRIDQGRGRGRGRGRGSPRGRSHPRLSVARRRLPERSRGGRRIRPPSFRYSVYSCTVVLVGAFSGSCMSMYSVVYRKEQ